VKKLAAEGIKVVQQENKGLGRTRNAGIRASRGAYILPLDADDRLRPGCIEHGIRILESNPQVGVVYGMPNASAREAVAGMSGRLIRIDCWSGNYNPRFCTVPACCLGTESRLRWHDARARI